jgi:hypothetical protein
MCLGAQGGGSAPNLSADRQPRVSLPDRSGTVTCDHRPANGCGSWAAGPDSSWERFVQTFVFPRRTSSAYQGIRAARSTVFHGGTP